jgi:tetratricopeptide (TPR) repeat protein
MPDPTSGAQIVKKLIAADPKLPESRALCTSVLLEMGNVQKVAGDSQEALLLYSQALQISPEDSQALYYIGVLAFEHGRHEDALNMFKRATAADAGNMQVSNPCLLCTIQLSAFGPAWPDRPFHSNCSNI